MKDTFGLEGIISDVLAVLASTAVEMLWRRATRDSEAVFVFVDRGKATPMKVTNRTSDKPTRDTIVELELLCVHHSSFQSD